MTAQSATSGDTPAEVERLVTDLRNLLAAERESLQRTADTRREIGTVVGTLTQHGVGYRRIASLVGVSHVTLYRRAATSAEGDHTGEDR